MYTITIVYQYIIKRESQYNTRFFVFSQIFSGFLLFNCDELKEASKARDEAAKELVAYKKF